MICRISEIAQNLMAEFEVVNLMTFRTVEKDFPSPIFWRFIGIEEAQKADSELKRSKPRFPPVCSSGSSRASG